jgi:type IV secretory pathway VirB10-like protein
MAEQNELPAELSALLSVDGDGPALPIDAVASANLVERALVATAGAPVRRKRVRRAGVLLAGVFVLTGSAAAMYAVQRAAQSAPAAEPSAVTRRATPAAPSVPPTPAPAAEPSATPTAPAPAPVAPARPVTEPRVPARASAVGAADDLLERANRMRGDGDYRGAERTYLRAVAVSPHGPAAYAASVAAAGLRLERFGDARGALQLYGSALRAQPKGALTPEIHEGMAHAYRTLGRNADERRALQALLSDQPSGPAAERARARLQVLDARP